MNKKLILTTLFGILSLVSFGQGFTLKQCIEYANRNNSDLRNAQYDLEITQKKVDEQIGSILPQVDISGSYTDNMKLSTTAMPAELVGGNAGETVAISMGTKHNLSAGANLNQKIYDPTFGVALKAAKIAKQQSEQTLRQTLEQVAYNISVT